MRTASVLAALWIVATPGFARQGDRHDLLDRILDTYVRDGKVYYRALKQDRGGLDRYIASLDVPAATVEAWPAAEQEAFWINAYNAIVLRTVVNAFPIPGRAAAYPPGSIRQIPGAFERLRHHVGGRQVTLDEIERDLVDRFGDARIVLALGRGALGSGRLRSEAFRADRLETQLAEAVKECAARAACVKIDPSAGTMSVVELIGWHEPAFIRSFAPADGRWANRSPIERAIAAMVFPHLFSRERELLTSETFRMTYHAFDWNLNELGASNE